MDQPFDVAQYVRILSRRWPLIVAPAFIGVIAAAVLAFITPVRYTATATLIAPKQQLVWRWDNKLYDLVDIRFDWRQEVISLVKTNAVAERALANVADDLSHPMSVSELREAIDVRASGGASLFTVSVTAAEAADAALLANAVAEALPQVIADLYAGDLESNQQALEEAKIRFEEWDKILVEFRGRTGISLGFSGALAANDETGVFGAQSYIKQHLTLKNSTRAALQDLVERIDLVVESASDGAGPPAVGLLDTPEMVAYGWSTDQLRQMATTDPAALIASLQTTRAQIQSDLERLTEEALALQTEHAQLLQEWEQILQQRGVWQESMTALERRDAELRIKRLVQGERVQVVDEATPPSRPSQPNWPLYLGLALVGGLLLGFLLAVAAVYLGAETPDAAA
ncbi:MAG: hypothetical protein GXP42_08565 [Chloroflexi bacterium]|nr:hypothetical protein [Chloroflexota bacterium]